MGSIDQDSIPYAYSKAVVSQRVQIALACLLVYDSITTLDREVKYFWTVPRQFVSLIYFTNRYIGITTAIFTIWYFSLSATKSLTVPLFSDSCIVTYWTHLVADWITLIVIDYILLMRVAALYFESRKVIRWLRTFFVLEALAELAMMLLNVFQRIGVDEMPGHISVCRLLRAVPARWSGFGIISWTIPIVYSVTLMTMALSRTIQFWKSASGSGSRVRLSSFQLVNVLIRDQALYFIAVILCSVSNIIANRLGSHAYADVFLINLLGSPSLLCILGSHLLFHLKEAAEKKSYYGGFDGQDVCLETQSFWAGESSIQFA